MRKSFVPQTEQVPVVTGDPFALNAATGSFISLFSLHFMQYASIQTPEQWFISRVNRAFQRQTPLVDRGMHPYAYTDTDESTAKRSSNTKDTKYTTVKQMKSISFVPFVFNWFCSRVTDGLPAIALQGHCNGM